LLAGKIGSVLAIQVIQLTVLVIAGFALGWKPVGGATAVFGVVLMVLCGTAAFASLGLLMAGVLRAEATLAAANLLYLLLLVGGAIMTPVEEYPESMQGVVRLLPSAALANGLANSTLEGVVPWAAALSLALWAAVLGYLVSRTFRWD
jgi:ABC-2 type transport system permease protein